MQDQQITAIILAATETQGMGDDYFENKTRHLLPIANKPLIQHLIETIDKCKGVGKKYILIEEKREEEEREKTCDVNYNLVFGERIGQDIDLIGQDPLTQVGTFAAVKGYIDNKKELFRWGNVPGNDSERLRRFLIYDLDIDWAENAEITKSGGGKTIRIFKDKNSAEIMIDEKKDKATLKISDGKTYYLKVKEENGKLNIYEDIFPILVIFGDTLVEENFLKRVVDKYNSEKEEKPRIIWGLAKTESNKRNVYCEHEDKEGFFEISGKEIVDCFQYPKNNNNLNNYLYLINTGIMVISEGAWENFHKLIDKIHRPSPYGFFTFENIIKQALVFRNIAEIQDIDLEVVGFVAPEGLWYEVNYPWEMLELNKAKISDLVKDTARTGEKGKSILIREEAEWTKEKEEEIGQKTILVQSDVKFTMSNGARIKGPCVLGKNTEVHDFAIQDYAVIENSYIGDGCTIGCHVVIHDSTLVKDITIQHDAVIEKSIIMEKSEIRYHSEILHSIIGKEVLISSDVRMLCQKLKILDGKPTAHKVTYFSDVGIKITDEFGAIIGDYCQIGSGTIIHPGRRIGKLSKIHANCEILINVNSQSRIRNKDITEGYD